MNNDGIIGKSGKWYPRQSGRHVDIADANSHDAPFVHIRYSIFPLAQTEVVPSRAQFEAVMEWCTQHNRKFEDMAIAPEWEKWLSD